MDPSASSSRSLAREPCLGDHDSLPLHQRSLPLLPQASATYHNPEHARPPRSLRDYPQSHPPSPEVHHETEENAPNTGPQTIQPTSDDSIENPPLPPGPPPADDPDDGWQPVVSSVRGGQALGFGHLLTRVRGFTAEVAQAR